MHWQWLKPRAKEELAELLTEDTAALIRADQENARRKAADAMIVEQLRDNIMSLPQEIFDEIFDLVFWAPADQETVISRDYKPPVQLQISRETRAKFSDAYYNHGATWTFGHENLSLAESISDWLDNPDWWFPPHSPERGSCKAWAGKWLESRTLQSIAKGSREHHRRGNKRFSVVLQVREDRFWTSWRRSFVVAQVECYHPGFDYDCSYSGPFTVLGVDLQVVEGKSRRVGWIRWLCGLSRRLH